MRNDRVLTAAPVGETSMLSWRLVYYYKMADCKKLWERETISREKRFDFVLISHRVVLLYCRDDNSVNPARFEPRLWRRLVPNLHDFYDWAIVLICAILCVFVVVVSSFGRSLTFFYSPSVFIFWLLSSTTEQSEQVHI